MFFKSLFLVLQYCTVSHLIIIKNATLINQYSSMSELKKSFLTAGAVLGQCPSSLNKTPGINSQFCQSFVLMLGSPLLPPSQSLAKLQVFSKPQVLPHFWGYDLHGLAEITQRFNYSPSWWRHKKRHPNRFSIGVKQGWAPVLFKRTQRSCVLSRSL